MYSNIIPCFHPAFETCNTLNTESQPVLAAPERITPLKTLPPSSKINSLHLFPTLPVGKHVLSPAHEPDCSSRGGSRRFYVAELLTRLLPADSPVFLRNLVNYYFNSLRGTPLSAKTLVIPDTIFFLASFEKPVQTYTWTIGIGLARTRVLKGLF